MSRLALTTALLCTGLAAVLVIKALARLGVARRVLRAAPPPGSPLARGSCALVGVLEPGGELVIAPFTERPALYARAVLRGVGPDGGAPRVLWEKVLVAPARLDGPAGGVPVDLAHARVIAPREYRQGALRALVPDVRLLPRVLVRAGYVQPPPWGQFFQLEEEVLAPGQRVYVLGAFDGARIAGAPEAPLVVSNLTRGRVALREAWGPALALLLATIILATGATVVATWLWLR